MPNSVLVWPKSGQSGQATASARSSANCQGVVDNLRRGLFIPKANARCHVPLPLLCLTCSAPSADVSWRPHLGQRCSAGPSSISAHRRACVRLDAVTSRWDAASGRGSADDRRIYTAARLCRGRERETREYRPQRTRPAFGGRSLGSCRRENLQELWPPGSRPSSLPAAAVKRTGRTTFAPSSRTNPGDPLLIRKFETFRPERASHQGYPRLRRSFQAGVDLHAPPRRRLTSPSARPPRSETHLRHRLGRSRPRRRRSARPDRARIFVPNGPVPALAPPSA